MKTGNLLYRCRMCGQMGQSFGVPNVGQAMESIVSIGRTTPEMGPVALTPTIVHACCGGTFGIADLIGATADLPGSPPAETIS